MNKKVGTTQKTLSELNDDCLQHILSFLPLTDKLILGNYLGEDRLLQVVLEKDVLYMENCVRRLTVDETTQILERFGYQIKNISLARPSYFTTNERRPYYEVIEAHCRSLEAIRLWYPACESELEIFRKILFTNNSVESICVRQEDRQIRHQLLPIIGNMQSIKYLDLTGFPNLTGEEISQMTSLVELNISRCESFDVENFIKLMNGNNLKSLDISYCRFFKNFAIQAFCDTQHELEHLVIDALTLSVNHERIEQLKKLKQLTLYNFKPLRHAAVFKDHKWNLQIAEISLPYIKSLKNLKVFHLLECLALDDYQLQVLALGIPTLEDLRIDICVGSDVCDVSGDGLIELIRILKSLQKFRFKIHSIKFDFDLLHKIIDAKKQGNPQPLKIYWGGDIHEDLLKSGLHFDNLDVLEVRPAENSYRPPQSLCPVHWKVDEVEEILFLQYAKLRIDIDRMLRL